MNDPCKTKRTWRYALLALVLGIGVVMSAVVGFAQNAVRVRMSRIAQEIVKLWPYVEDPKKFSSPDNEKEIARHIQGLQTAVESASHQSKLAQGDYQQTIELLLTHINDTEKTFKRGQKELARYMTQSTLQACIACHSRMPGQEAWVPLPAQQKMDTFSKAEFLFATRRFHEAQDLFQKLIAEYPKNGLELTQVQDALDYVATMYVRIDRNPQEAVNALRKIVDRKNLPAFVQEDIEMWHQMLRAWSSEPPFEVKKHSDQEVLAKAKEIVASFNNRFYMSDRSKHIAYLRASTLLHELLTERPQTNVAAEAYYLLGVCYTSINQKFFFGFDQMYLKTCLRNFTDDPIAKKCYNLLEKSIYLGYSGSSGTHIPYDVMQELNHFRKKVY